MRGNRHAPEVSKAAAQVLAKVEKQPKLKPPKDHSGPAGVMQSELRGWFSQERAPGTNRIFRP